MNIFDTHAHIFSEYYENIAETIKEAKNNNVTHITIPGYDLKSSKEAVEIANKFENVYATVGIHPSEASTFKNEEDFRSQLNEIKTLAQNQKVVAIGEIGLDYYWVKDNKEEQSKLLIEQINIANEMNLPVVLHIREATIDALNILTEHPVNKTGIFHCVPLNEHLIKEGLKLGYYISFAGVITFKNSKPEESVNLVPEDKILVETDSPYLTPHPFRGEQNKPANVVYTLEKMADLRNVSKEDLANQTFNNSLKVYGLKK